MLNCVTECIVHMNDDNCHVSYVQVTDAYEFASYNSLYDVDVNDVDVKYCGLYDNDALIALMGFK